MIKGFKGKFDTPKKVIKDKKKQSAAYILLGFFAFVFIASILGIIAFFRTNKKDESAFNVVNASANVVNDMWSQGSTNETTVFVKNPIYLHDHIITDDGYSLEVINGTNQEYEEDFDAFFPYFNYLYQGIEDADELFIAFSINKGDDWFFEVNTYPYIVLQYFDENENVINTVGFDMAVNQHSAVYGVVYTMHYKKPSFDYNNAFFMISYPDYGDVELVFNRFFIEDVQVKEMPSFNGYAYTYNQMQDIYMQEIADAYHEGLQATDGYNQGYDEGFSAALENIHTSFSGIFYGAQCDLIASNSIHEIYEQDIATYLFNGYINLSYVFLEYAPSYQEFGNASFTFKFHNFEYTPLNLPEYIFNFNVQSNVGDTEPNWDMNVEPFFIRIYTNLNVYDGRYEPVDDYKFRIVVDLTSMRADEVIQEVNIYGLAQRLYRAQFSVTNEDYRYMLGYDYGYDVAYDAFRNQYALELQLEYNKGLNAGRDVGYNEGYNAGAEASGNYTFTSLIGSVVDVPIKAFTSLFNFEILGVNLANFFFALFTMMLVLAVIKFII